MGRAGTEGFAELVEAGEVSLETSLEWHLQDNHFPPLPKTLIPICVEAIQRANDGDWDADVKFPSHSNFRDSAKVSDLVEALHLEAFIQDPDS
jgi:hypothetical protein